MGGFVLLAILENLCLQVSLSSVVTTPGLRPLIAPTSSNDSLSTPKTSHPQDAGHELAIATIDFSILDGFTRMRPIDLFASICGVSRLLSRSHWTASSGSCVLRVGRGAEFKSHGTPQERKPARAGLGAFNHRLVIRSQTSPYVSSSLSTAFRNFVLRPSLLPRILMYRFRRARAYVWPHTSSNNLKHKGWLTEGSANSCLHSEHMARMFAVLPTWRALKEMPFYTRRLAPRAGLEPAT